MASDDLLNIVDETGKIIGKERRDIIHQKGLLHREVHVLFYTPNKEIIFQHRAKNKDSFPDLLDAAVGGHVEIGETNEEAAIKETREETGISVSKLDLEFIKYIHIKVFDEVTGLTNHALKAEFAYLYEGKVEDLKIEKGKSLGFEAWPIEKLLHASENDKRKFTPLTFTDQILDMFKYLAEK